MSEYDPQRVVIIHEGDVDPSKLVMLAGIPLPVSIHSFTNDSSQNDSLPSVAGDAHHMLIDERSHDKMSLDIERATDKLSIRSHPHTVRIFREDTMIRILSAPGYDRQALEEELHAYRTERVLQ